MFLLSSSHIYWEEHGKSMGIVWQRQRRTNIVPSTRKKILCYLCTDYGETTVQYATEGLSQNMFVSKYRLQMSLRKLFL